MQVFTIPEGLLDMRQRPEPDAMPPQDIQAAIAFIRLCNDYTGMKPVVTSTDMETDCEVFEQELPVDQDAAFRLACRRLASYFVQHTPREVRRGKKETPPQAEAGPQS